MEIEVLIVN